MYTFEDGVLKIWTWYSNAEGDPTILQPFDPATGEDWADEATAAAWADDFLAQPENIAPVVEPVVDESSEEGTDLALVAEQE